MEEVLYEDVKYKGKMGSLMLNDEMLVYQADPPYKSSVKCSWALIAKRQVCAKSAAQQHIKIVTLSGKTAAFYVRDRETLEEIREDMKQRINEMRAKERLRQQREHQREQERGNNGRQYADRQVHPVRQFWNYLLPPQSSSEVQRLLQQDGNTMALLALQQKYSREIKQDPEIIALNEQIQFTKNQIQQQRVQQQQLQREQFELHQQQVFVNEQTIILKQALAEIIHFDDIEEPNNKQKAMKKEYSKTISKATANNKTPTPGMYTLGAAQKSNNRSQEKEAAALEAWILQKMHHQMCMQNQSSLAQKNTLILKSNLMMAKRELDNDYAQGLQYLMVLEGTENALSDMYPDIVLRQELLIERMQNKDTRPKANGEVPQLILSPQAMTLKRKGRRPSGTQSDGISDLGESLMNGENQYTEREEYHPPATMTTVESLQQSTLNEMAGVEN